MPNPILPPQTFAPPPERVPTEHNGILAWVPGDLTSSGSRQFPRAREGEEETRCAVVEVPSIGMVRITYHLSSYRHGKTKNWHWVAVWADEVV